MIWTIAGGVMLGGVGLFLLRAIVLIAFHYGGGWYGAGLRTATKAVLGLTIVALVALLGVLTI